MVVHVQTRGMERDRRFGRGRRALVASGTTTGSGRTLCGAPATPNDAGQREAFYLRRDSRIGMWDRAAEQATDAAGYWRRVADEKRARLESICPECMAALGEEPPK